jgi:hypothetical protein
MMFIYKTETFTSYNDRDFKWTQSSLKFSSKTFLFLLEDIVDDGERKKERKTRIILINHLTERIQVNISFPHSCGLHQQFRVNGSIGQCGVQNLATYKV